MYFRVYSYHVVVVVVGNKRKAEVVELDDENSSSDDECNIHILCSCQLVKFNMYFS